MPERLFIQLYKALLRLYPRNFHVEFSDEMLEVFSQSLSHRAEHGRPTSVAIFLHELRELPRLALMQRLHDRRGRATITVPVERWEGALSRKGLLVAMVAFTIPMVAILLEATPASLLSPLLLSALVFMCCVLAIGIIRGIPRWCLPYLGLALSMISFLFVFNWVADILVSSVLVKVGPEPWDQSTRLLWQSFIAGMMWCSLFVILTFVIAVFAVVGRLHQFYRRVRQDWTLVSFILYCGAMTALVLLFENYRHQEPYAIASLICLATGAWFYLRSPHPRQRALALLSGLTLAMWIAAAGKWALVPRQDWIVWFQRYPPETERWFEAGRTLMEWGWMVFFLLAPRLLKYFPLSKETVLRGPTHPAPG